MSLGLLAAVDKSSDFPTGMSAFGSDARIRAVRREFRAFIDTPRRVGGMKFPVVASFLRYTAGQCVATEPRGECLDRNRPKGLACKFDRFQRAVNR